MIIVPVSIVYILLPENKREAEPFPIWPKSDECFPPNLISGELFPGKEMI